ncbi:cell wall protein DAN4 isoform X2 [Rhagoletis pomonella]|uniref:cell wall protein DAN4 isoform X2 n=1 Tax=Rhagoletis pomonella TaxID=28610 RepID=UPI001783CAF9|nr:cell wall protein DAN4 isoform X2 [Rhagoletis pomonella]
MQHARRQQALSNQFPHCTRMFNNSRHSRLWLNSIAMLICLLCSGLASTNADCQKDGKTYLNGDKLVDPETPCTVCYCQGGEILCSSVTCFYRDDCKPKYVQGRCCPEYDNCPVSILDPSQNVNKSQHSPTPAAEMNAATAQPSSPVPPVVANNPKITIKEITKPIEIRITDDNKAIPIHQMLKPQATTTTSTTTTTTTTTTTEQSPVTTSTAAAAAAATVDSGSSTLTPPSPPTPSTTTTTTASTSALSPTTPTTRADLEQIHSGENTSIPTTASSSGNTGNKKATSVDNNPPTVLPVPGGINNGESLKLSASVAYPSTERNTVTVIIPAQSVASAENSSNDSGEISAEVAPLAEDGGAIPAFGAQQLQHDASSNDPTKVNIKRENLATTERVTAASTAGEEFGSPELIDGNGSGQSGGLQIQGTFDLEPETSGSDNIYHIILTTSGPRVNEYTDPFAGFKTTEDAPHGSTVDIQAAASNQQHTVVVPPPQLSNTTDSPFDSDSTTRQATTSPTATSSSPASAYPASSTDAPELSSTSTEPVKPLHSTESGHHMEEEEAAIPIEANPAYPSLPEDDFSLRDVTFPLNEADDAVETDVKDEQRSIGGGAFEVVKVRKPAEEGSGSGFELIEGSSTTEYEGLSSDSTNESVSKLPTKVALLMNSAEDLSSETAISNSSDFQLDRFSRLASNDTKESAETEELGSGESAEAVEQKLEKRREPTTPRPKPRAAAEVDIDELGDVASGDGNSDPKEDPKLDAESIKADEDVEEGIVKQETGQKEDVLTVNAKPTEERTVEEVPAATLDRIQRLFLQRFI